MLTRRDFISSVSLPALALPVLALARPAWSDHALDILAEIERMDAADPATENDDFWRTVAAAFTVDRSILNLNNGGCCPSPALVQNAMKRNLDFSNTAPTYALWRILEPQREAVREQLAQAWGTSAEELAITRNASESLQICQLGFDLQPGDEVLTSSQDYPRMLTTFRQRERRDGIVLKVIDLPPAPCEDDAAVVHAFQQAITPKTRLMLISHCVFLNGQILPVKKLVQMARARGIPTIVDGAHALAQFDFKITDLDADYYGVSLHKWLFAPHGTGLLYVRKDKINSLWPMMASEAAQADDIRKFEEIGTHPAANALGIAEALTFHHTLGGKRKEARLRWLRDRWAKRLLAHKSGRVRLHTSLKPQFSCAIGTVEILGLDAAKLSGHLWDAHRILTTTIDLKGQFKGLRITPCVYTLPQEIDRFCEVVEGLIEKGLPEPQATAK